MRETFRERRPNPTEKAFHDLAEQNGWNASKRGWPDYLCWKDSEIIAVEVKPRKPDGQLKCLRRDQTRVLDALTAHGIRCYVSDGEKLERYDPQKHAQPKHSGNAATAYHGSVIQPPAREAKPHPRILYLTG